MVVLAGLTVSACAKRGESGKSGHPGGFVWGRTPAAGATSTCPDDVVDLTGNRHTPTSDQIRCSYADAGATVASVEGTVLVDEPGGLGRGVEGVEVVLVRMDEGGQAARVASTLTDAQGGFSLRAQVRAGSFALRAAGSTTPTWQWDRRGPWKRDAQLLRIAPEEATRAATPRPSAP